MALDPASGFVAAIGLSTLDPDSLPVFNVERVQLQFPISSDFVAAQVANNVLILALSSGRILRIDLDNPADIDDIDLPKKVSEVGVIRSLFLDPTASHLVISTTSAENFYLHSQSRHPRPLSRLKGVSIECIAWNPLLPTASTREILLGTSDGNVYELFLEPVSGGFRRDDLKHFKAVYKVPDGPVTGLWIDALAGKPDLRRVLVATPSTLLHFVGKLGRPGHDGGSSLFTHLFEAEAPVVHDSKSSGFPRSSLVISPQPPDSPTLDNDGSERTFAWLSLPGVRHGKLLVSPTTLELGSKVFAESKLLTKSQLPPPPEVPSNHRRRSGQQPAQDSISSIALTQWHMLILVADRVVAVNRLDNKVVLDQSVLEPGQRALGLITDQRKNTFWLFTNKEIFEVVSNDEDRDVWRIMLQSNNFEAALRYAKSTSQKDAVATASGDFLVGQRQFLKAAAIFGKSSKPFEQVALTFIDEDEPDALRKYLVTKLSTYKKSSTMQRVMLASWLVEVFMSKLNSLDDTITTKAELAEHLSPEETRDQLSSIRLEYQDFITRYKGDLDRKTAYDIISSHGREEELLFFASAINDYNYVLAYWVQRERWPETLNVLKKQTDPEIFYKYSSALMSNAAVELVDILTRQSNINPRNLIPALLNYNRNTRVPLSQNQAIRYLNFVINQLHSDDAAVHNTLISIYASHPSRDESALLSYFDAQSVLHRQSYDADFALRLCIQYKRVQSCVHIYSSMGQYLQAVELALKHDEVDLASIVADRPEDNSPLRKKLWLAVAKKVISQSDGIKTAIDFLKRCELLKIEDLIPFFPDFVVIDDFKEEICAALEEYSRHIDSLKQEMDESAQTASNIKVDIATLDHRYAIVEPGERCYICQYPLLSRQFFVFPCQHAFHSDCLGQKIVKQAGPAKSRRIRELQSEVSRGISIGKKREKAIAELDALIASSCILCSDFAVKLIDEPFVLPSDDRSEWAL
ncbi:MAG: hypothetical protein M1829_001785 [Trizodia sp. TS-e1964]|nr:MAG: hypothetical protein M1829_001785 [Trizodia sp. TS-e1964]